MIELVIALAVLASLATVALASYNEYVMRSHRAHARAALLQSAQWMERTATAQGAQPLAAAIPPGVLLVEGRRYNVVAVSNNGVAYTLGRRQTRPNQVIGAHHSISIRPISERKLPP